MFVSVLLLVASLGAILAAAELFTNGIEWLGRRLRLGDGAVGSVLAAVGTALPETMIPIVALLGASDGHMRDEVGIGAILGAPLMLSTLGFCITGAGVLIFTATKRRDAVMTADPKVIGRDLVSFGLAYAVALGATFVPYREGRIAIAVALCLLYAFYVWQTFRHNHAAEAGRELHPLHLAKRLNVPRLRHVALQVFCAVLLMIGGAQMFVARLTEIAEATGVSALVLSLILAPIATELPEKFNSVIWVRQKKDTLALGNMTGAMVFQSSIPPALGILCTDWQLTPDALAAGIATLVASAFAFVEMTVRKRISPYSLLCGAVVYTVYIAYIMSNGPQPGAH